VIVDPFPEGARVERFRSRRTCSHWGLLAVTLVSSAVLDGCIDLVGGLSIDAGISHTATTSDATVAGAAGPGSDSVAGGPSDSSANADAGGPPDSSVNTDGGQADSSATADAGGPPDSSGNADAGGQADSSGNDDVSEPAEAGPDGNANAPGACGPTNCPEGCCDDAGICEPATASATCGAGAACAVCGVGPSCQTSGAGITDCGAANESCCTSLEVTGGTYYRTYTYSGGGPTGEADPATVSSFRLEKYLVTVGRFRQFVAAWNGGAGWLPSAGSGKHTHLNGGQGLNATGGGFEPGWVASDDPSVAPTNANLACTGQLVPNLATGSHYDTWTPSVASQENWPITCVNWYEAYAFCIWDNGFLPSEAEWEYAAVGGSEERHYPWGTAAPGTSSQYAIYACYYPSGSGSCTGVVNFAPVGTAALGVGAWGQLDLAGSVWEWNLDWHAGYVNPCVDCANFTPATQRSDQGGDFNTGTGQFPPFRGANNPADEGAYAYGFRCARTP
jgi:formylglycine-generating enzyme